MKNLFLITLIITFSSSSLLLAASYKNEGMSRAPMNAPRGFSQYSPSIGIRAGVAETEGNQYDASPEYGFEMGFEPIPELGLALEVSLYHNDPGQNVQELTRTKLLAKAQYNFGGTTPFFRYSYIGVGVGPVTDQFADNTNTEFGIAPMLGFDIPFPDRTSQFTLGANANYLFIENTDVPQTFAINGAVKYWF